MFGRARSSGRGRVAGLGVSPDEAADGIRGGGSGWALSTGLTPGGAPTLLVLGLTRRRPYQTRHTTATLWLASGESPEWIAQQLGHSTTKMLFEVYSRFIPNATRQDGSAFNSLIAST